MKNSFLSVGTIAVILISSCYGFAQVQGSALESDGTFDNSRMNLANLIESKGQKLQLIQDEQGIEKAHEIFAQERVSFITSLNATIKNQLMSISENQALEVIHQIQQHLTNISYSEDEYLILSNQSLTPQQKLASFIESKMLLQAQQETSQIQERADEVGYALTFREFAQILRSRTFLDPVYNAVANSFKWSDECYMYFIGIIGKLGGWRGGHWKGKTGYYRTETTMVGLGLGVSGPVGVMLSLGFGDEDGSYVGIHLMGGAALCLTFGIYTNGKRVLFLFGFGPGIGASAALSALDLTKTQ